MKVYIEEIEETSTHGVTDYSLVQGMEIYLAEVRASGIEIWKRDMDSNTEAELDHDSDKYKELSEELTKEIYKEK